MPERGLFDMPGHDATQGRALGEAGMAQVAANAGEWFAGAQRTVQRICQLYPNRTLTGEKLGNAVVQMYCAPHDAHVWGALINWAVRAGLIVKTGLRLRMEKPRSHGRTTDQYRIVMR